MFWATWEFWAVIVAWLGVAISWWGALQAGASASEANRIQREIADRDKQRFDAEQAARALKPLRVIAQRNQLFWLNAGQSPLTDIKFAVMSLDLRWDPTEAYYTAQYMPEAVDHADDLDQGLKMPATGIINYARYLVHDTLIKQVYPVNQVGKKEVAIVCEFLVVVEYQHFAEQMTVVDPFQVTGQFSAYPQGAERALNNHVPSWFLALTVTSDKQASREIIAAFEALQRPSL